MSEIFGAVPFAARPQAEAAQTESTGHARCDRDYDAKRDQEAVQTGEHIDDGGRERAYDGVNEPQNEVKQRQWNVPLHQLIGYWLRYPTHLWV